MSASRIMGLAVVAVLLLSARATAEPASPDVVVDVAPPSPEPLPSRHLKMRDPGLLTTHNGRVFILPVGHHIVDDPTWGTLDAELLRLQELETRITAENKSLRKSQESWQPGPYTLVVAFLAGTAGGWYLHSKL